MDPELADLVCRVTALEIQFSALQADIAWLTRLIGGLVLANIGSIGLNSFYAWRNNRRKE